MPPSRRVAIHNPMYGRTLSLHDRVTQSTSRRRKTPRASWPLVLLIVVTVAVSAVALPRLLDSDYDPEALRRMTESVLKPLQHDTPAAILSVTAEGKWGADLLREESRRSYVDPAVMDSFYEPGSEKVDARLAALAALRAEGERVGIVWDTIEPLAFSGVLASVFLPALMSDPGIAIIGDIYLQSDSGVFAIEVSARQCNDFFVVQELWGCRAVDAMADDLRAAARARYEAYRDETALPGSQVEVSANTYIYLAL